jgi:hypothetical protein
VPTRAPKRISDVLVVTANSRDASAAEVVTSK